MCVNSEGLDANAVKTSATLTSTPSNSIFFVKLKIEAERRLVVPHDVFAAVFLRQSIIGALFFPLDYSESLSENESQPDTDVPFLRHSYVHDQYIICSNGHLR